MASASTNRDDRPGHAVVLVSGGDASTPFTTPDRACGGGMAAGITNTHLRAHLLEHGVTVYTAPATNRRGPVIEPGADSDDSFADCPPALAAHLTITSTGDIDLAGERLTRFIGYLADHHDVSEIDLVGHSNGGLFSRAAIRIMHETASPVRVRSLTTLGTPWHGAFGLRYLAGELDRDICAGDRWCERMLDSIGGEVRARDLGLAAQNTRHYLDGDAGWNTAQSGVLDAIPVLLVGGDRFTNDAGHPAVWPLDGYVSLHSALATEVPRTVLPHRHTLVRPDTHSVYLSRRMDLPDHTALTADPVVLDAVLAMVTRGSPD